MYKNDAVPCNSKSLLASIYGTMGKLTRGEIKAQEAIAFAKLASQACNLLNYELKRTYILIQLDEYKKRAIDCDVHLREIESKGFDEK